MLVIVPNALRDAINRKLDAALANMPEAAKHRDHFFDELLAYYNDHGTLPDFTIAAR